MNEQIARITKEAEEKYPLREMPPNLADSYDELKAQKDVIEYNSFRKIMIKAYIAGATPYAERSEKLRECLQEAKLQIEYLHGKFKTTGTGMIVISKINSALNNNL